MKKICILGKGYLGNHLYKYLINLKDPYYHVDLLSIRGNINLNLLNFDLIIDTADRASGLHDNFIQKKLKHIRGDDEFSNINYLYLSSASIYSEKIDEITENSQIVPNNFYQINKIKNEKLILKNKHQFIILRLSNIWGLDSPVGTFIGDQLLKLRNHSKLEIKNNDYKSFIDLVNYYDLINIIYNFIKLDEFQNLTLNICTGYSFKISYLKNCFNNKKNIKLLENNYKRVFNTKNIKKLGFRIPLNFGHYYNKSKSDFYNKNVNY